MAATNGEPTSERVAQAQGMVSVQANCTLDEALELITARANESRLSLETIAAAVVDRSIRFGD